jgi:hypothetical protein
MQRANVVVLGFLLFGTAVAPVQAQTESALTWLFLAHTCGEA